MPGTGTQVHTPRRVRSLGDRVVVVGDVATDGVSQAFLALLSASDLAVDGAVVVAGVTSAALDDAAIVGDALVAVGAVDDRGVVLTLGADDLAVRDALRFEQVAKVAAVEADANGALVVANQGNALIAGALTGDAIDGVRHLDVQRPAFFGPVPLFVDDDGATMVGRVAGTQRAREQPLSASFAGRCGDDDTGELASILGVSSGAVITTPTLLSSSLTIATDTLDGVRDTAAAASSALCP